MATVIASNPHPCMTAMAGFVTLSPITTSTIGEHGHPAHFPWSANPAPNLAGRIAYNSPVSKTKRLSPSRSRITEQFERPVVSDTFLWLDNRFDKKKIKAMDFKQKSTRKVPPVENGSSSRWVKAELIAIAPGQRQFGDSVLSESHVATGYKRIKEHHGNGREARTLHVEGGDMKAMYMLDAMDQQSIKVKIGTYISLLRRCISMKLLKEGKLVHAHILRNGLTINSFLGNTLINMYSKCGSVVDARQVFDKMPKRTVCTWNTMIACYTKLGHADEALKLFQQMQEEDMKPNELTFVSVIKASAMLGVLEQGKEMFGQSGSESDILVKNTLADMYGKVGNIEQAFHVFDKIPKPEVMSWTVMIAGHAERGNVEEAFKLFQQMVQKGVKPSKATFLTILKACGTPAALENVKHIHAQIINSGFETDNFLGSILVDTYSKCGAIEHARSMFNKMHNRTVISWTAMISGYVQHGHANEALELFWQMERGIVKPNELTVVSILKACSSIAALEEGKQVHAYIIKSGLESAAFVGNTLIDMYSKCGSLNHARQVFDKMRDRDVVSWTAMIAGYTEHGHFEEALGLFQQMEHEGINPNAITFVTILKACTSLAALERGKKIHTHIIESGFESNVYVGSTLVDMYANCGSIQLAWQVFDKMPERNVVSWTAMIAGYVEHGYADKALELFWQMKMQNVRPDKVTFVSILKACASVAALKQGKHIHLLICKSGLESDVSVGSALIDMYAKCGSIENARQVFDKMYKRDVVTWNAMIAGYAQHGHAEDCLKLAEEMQVEGVKLDDITFVCILSACSHSGLLDEGCHYFNSMNESHGITPIGDHYACMVDLLCRAGHLEEAENFIERMPVQPSTVVWTALLGACKIHGNVELARLAAKCILELEPNSSRAFVLLSNIYGATGRWYDKAKLREMMAGSGMEKNLGLSHIEVNNQVHTFGM